MPVRRRPPHPPAARPTRLRVLLAVALVVVLAGCGSTGGGGPGAAGGSDTATAETTPLLDPLRPAEGGAGDGAGSRAVAGDVAPRPSAGCGSGTPGPWEERRELVSDGARRWYHLAVPAAHDGRTPIPLLVDLPGYSVDADLYRAVSEMGRVGAEEGVVVVTPQGQGSVPFWNVAHAEHGLARDDVAFVADLLDGVSADLCVDEARTYATGMSNGGLMAARLRCDLADRIAAVGAVAGIADLGECEPSRPVPVIAVHGTADPILPFEGGVGPAIRTLPTGDGLELLAPVVADPVPVPEAVTRIARANGCRGRSEATPVGEQVEVRAHECPAGAPTSLVVVEGGGHTWPGRPVGAEVEAVIGPTTTEVSAGDLLWGFLRQFALPR